jgi:hypothetical protein
MFSQHPFDPAQFFRTVAKVPSQGNRIEPELGGLIAPVNMNVWSFVELMTVEVHSIRADSENRRHESTSWRIILQDYISNYTPKMQQGTASQSLPLSCLPPGADRLNVSD